MIIRVLLSSWDTSDMGRAVLNGLELLSELSLNISGKHAPDVIFHQGLE